MLEQRGFVYVDGRQIHYHLWGRGPAVLAIHGSPQSARAVAPIAKVIAAKGLCVIAPDTPGNGLSDPLTVPYERIGSEDYARALAQFADAMGVARTGVYGFHTGAATACAFAALYPQRTAAVVMEGLPGWSDEERADLVARYLPPFVPRWDGSHMTWLWARMEEQTLFFPWHAPTAATRMAYNVSPPDSIHANCMDVLESGDNHRMPYLAALTFRCESWLHRVQGPKLICLTASDVLAPHLARPVFAAHFPRVFDSANALHAAAAEFLAARSGQDAPVAPSSGGDRFGMSRGYVKSGDGSLAWRGSDSGRGRPLILIHAAGSSGDEFEPMLTEFAGARPIFAIDLPGHGASKDGWMEIPRNTQGISAIVADALANLGVMDPAVAGVHFGGQVAHSLAVSATAARAATLGASAFPGEEGEGIRKHGAPPLAPEWDGAHLVRAYRIARWERLYMPWFERTVSKARKPFGELDPTYVNARAVNLLKAHSRWSACVAAECDYDWSGPKDHLTALAIENDPLSAAERFSRIGLHPCRLPEDRACWAGVLAGFAG